MRKKKLKNKIQHTFQLKYMHNLIAKIETMPYYYIIGLTINLHTPASWDGTEKNVGHQEVS